MAAAIQTAYENREAFGVYNLEAVKAYGIEPVAAELDEIIIKCIER